MKHILSFIAVLFAALSVHAQFISGSTPQNALSITTPVKLGTLGASNLPTTLAKVITIGAGGFGVSATIGSTNALAVTNGMAVLDLISDIYGTNANTVGNVIVNFAPNGTSPLYYWTNIQSTVANIGNLRAVRFRYISNANFENIWVTNLTIWTR